MSGAQTLGLGAIAGAAILLGLPTARLPSVDPRIRVALSSLATGILLFLFWDVLSHGVAPVEATLKAHHWGRFAELAALLAGGFTLGTMALVYYDRWMSGKRHSRLVGPGAAAVDEFKARGIASLSPARRLALLIATGIGIHNFGEGLAIGQSAAAGEIGLAVALIVGFALHNATEGFGICGPLAAEGERPTWAFLGLLGLVGGGPTFIGTAVGHAWASTAVSVACFAIAAGSILYVVEQLFHVNRKFANPTLVTWMVLAGLALGFGTDFVVTAAGA